MFIVFLSVSKTFVFSFWMLPTLVLKKFIIGNLETSRMDVSIARAIDFMSERVSCGM